MLALKVSHLGKHLNSQPAGMVGQPTSFLLPHPGITSQINLIHASPCLGLCFQRELRRLQSSESQWGPCLFLRPVSNKFKIRKSSWNCLKASIEHHEVKSCSFCFLLLWIIVLQLFPDVHGYESREYRWSVTYNPDRYQNRKKSSCVSVSWNECF